MCFKNKYYNFYQSGEKCLYIYHMKQVSVKVTEEANKVAQQVKELTGVSMIKFISESIIAQAQKLPKKIREQLNPKL